MNISTYWWDTFMKVERLMETEKWYLLLPSGKKSPGANTKKIFSR